MKILIIHNNYQQFGGERTAVEAQLHLLQNHSIILYQRDNLELNKFGLAQKVHFFRETIYSKRTFCEIHDIVSKERPDIAHIHNVFPLISPSVYWVLHKTGIPIVQTMHNFRFLCPNGLFYTHHHVCELCKYGNTIHSIVNKCYRSSYLLSALYALTIGFHRQFGTFAFIDRFITLTQFSRQKLVTSGLTTPEKISVLGNFIEDPFPSPGDYKNRDPYIVYLGRLSAEKGITTLVEAMKDIPDLRLKVLGNGPLFSELSETIRIYGLENIELLGHISGDQKWDILRKAIALVVPSECYESFPISSIESLAVGTPVIASNLGSLPYIIEHGKNGFLFQPGNFEDLRQKILYLTNNAKEALKMGIYGRQTVMENYSSNAHRNKLLKIYEEVEG